MFENFANYLYIRFLAFLYVKIIIIEKILQSKLFPKYKKMPRMPIDIW